MKKSLVFILLLTLSISANNIFLEELHKSYKDEQQIQNNFKFIEKPNEEKQQKVQEEFLRLLPLYLNEQNPFDVTNNPKDNNHASQFGDMFQFIRILTAYTHLKIQQDKQEEVKILYAHTLQSFKIFMSNRENLLFYIGSLEFYDNYFSSLQCNDQKTKDILLKNYPLEAKEIYLTVMKNDSEELLLLTEKELKVNLTHDFNLSTTRTAHLTQQMMVKLREASNLEMKRLNIAINDGSEEALTRLKEFNLQKEDNQIEVFVKSIYSISIIWINDLLGINEEYLVYLPEILANTLINVARVDSLKFYYEHQKLLKRYQVIINECK